MNTEGSINPVWLAAPQTFDDYLGWTVAIVVFLLILAWTIRAWKDLFNKGAPFTFLLHFFTGNGNSIRTLLICGDEESCEADEAQLQRARISFRKLERATLDDIERELQRRRIDGTLYRWVHISAHGSRAGFSLGNNEMMTTEWVADHFEGIKVVFAASCDSVDAGDALVGIVDSVVVVYGRRGSGLISTFANVFWREMAETGNARNSYRTALTEVPQLRPFVDLRMR